MNRVYNFSPGPSTLPVKVLEQVQKDFVCYKSTGMSVIEMSHRSGMFLEIYNSAVTNLKTLLNIGDDYSVLFLHGGATQQFSAVPLNMPIKSGKALYVDSGSFAAKAAKEAKKYKEVEIIASSKNDNYTYVPKFDVDSIDKNADYLHITTNNTIYGTKYTSIPEISIPLVADASSNILSENYDISKFAAIYAGAQKNIGPSGLCVLVAKKEYIVEPMSNCPILQSWKIQDENESMYNTPNTFGIYVANLVFENLLSIGGVTEIEKINRYKAGLLYDFIDNSSLFKGTANKEYRSLMNATFVTGDENLDKEFVSQAAKAGLVNLKGHRSVGGMRASIYNAMPVEGVEALVDFMKKFELENGGK